MYDSHDEESPPPPLEQQGGEHEWYNSRFGIGKGTAGKSKYPSKAKQNRMRNTRNKDKDDDYNDNGGGGLQCGGLKDVVEEGGNYAMITTAGNFRSSTISALGMSSLFLDPKNVLDDLNKTANEYDEYEAQAIIIEEEEEIRQQHQLQLQQQQQQRKISSSSSNRNIKKKIIQGQIERDKELKELEDVVLNYKHDHKEQEEEEQRSRESRDHQEQKQRGLLKIASSPISKQQSKSDDYDYDDDDIEENNNSAVVVVESKMMSRHTKKRIMEMKIYYTIGIIIFITMCILFAYGGYIIYRNKHS